MLEMRKITEAELSVCREQMLKRLRKELTDVISKNTVYIYMVFCAGFLCCASWYCLRGFVREVIEDLIPCSLLLTCVLVLWLWLWLWLCMLLLTCVLVLWLKNLLESTQCSTVNPIAQVKDCIEKLRKVKRGDLYVEPIEILQKETLTVAGACYPNVPVYCIVLKGEEKSYSVVVEKDAYEQLESGNAFVVYTEKNTGTWSLRMSKNEIESVVQSGRAVKLQWFEDRKLKDVYM